MMELSSEAGKYSCVSGWGKWVEWRETSEWRMYLRDSNVKIPEGS